jgi:hypothetical protein
VGDFRQSGFCYCDHIGNRVRRFSIGETMMGLYGIDKDNLQSLLFDAIVIAIIVAALYFGGA